MFDGPAVVQALKACGATHVVWIPDSYLGLWESALQADPELQLIRVTREGEAIALAAGLLVGGQRPVVMLQCTGLFEAGDALRNVVHDLKLPLFLIIGLRGYLARQRGDQTDTCPVFAEPILRAWKLTYRLLTQADQFEEIGHAYRQTLATGEPRAVVIVE